MKRPLVYVTIPFSCGILFSHFFKTSLIYNFIFGIAFLAVAFLYLKKNVISHISLYLAIFCLAVLSYQNATILPGNHIYNLISSDEKRIYIKGLIVDDPIISTTFYNTDKSSFVLSVDSFRGDSSWKKAVGLVKVDIHINPATLDARNIGFGDEVILKGVISRPNSLRNPGLFDYSKYMEIKGIYHLVRTQKDSFIKIVGKDESNPVKKMAYGVRGKIRNLLNIYFIEPYNGFLKAILIGDRSGLDSSLKDDFVKTGTVHILAISGLHVGLIAGLFLFIFSLFRVPKRIAFILTALILIFYSFVAGLNPPVIRATIMFLIIVLGYIMNRDSDILNSLSLAAMAILFWNPKELFDPSFQLSFMSIASIVVLTPKIDAVSGVNSLARNSIYGKVKFYILKSIAVSIAAWAGVWPFISSYFNIASPVAIIANIVVIPMLFVIMMLSFFFLLAGMAVNFLTIYAVYLLYTIQDALFFINKGLSQLPFSYFRTGAPSFGFSIIYYCGLSMVIMPKVTEIGRIKMHKKHAIILLLLALNVIAWKHIIDLKKDFLKITFLDVGQGDSILIEFPKKGTILIDGGSGGEDERFDMGESVIVPYLLNNGIRKLDGVIVTHFHEDHLGGIIYVLKNYDVGCVIDNGTSVSSDNKVYDYYLEAIKERRIRRLVIGEGDVLEGFGDQRLFVLNPNKEEASSDPPSAANDNSIVLKLVYKNSNILLCGDITDKAIDRLDSYGIFLKSDILKVPHHGGFIGNENTVKKFFTLVSPKISVISTGGENRFKEPIIKTINILTYLNSISYSTKFNGAIRVFLYANSYKIGLEKK